MNLKRITLKNEEKFGFKLALILIFLLPLFSLIKSNKADEIIEKHIKKLGGRDKINKIKDVTIKTRTINRGIVTDIITYNKRPDKYLQLQYRNGKEFQRIYVNGKNIRMFAISQKGNTIEYTLNDDAKIYLLLNLSPFKEIDAEQFQPSKKYLKLINDKTTGVSVHAIEYKIGNVVWNSYYDAKADLLLTEKSAHSITILNEPLSEPKEIATELEGYKLFNGVYFIIKSLDMEGGKIISRKENYDIQLNKNLPEILFSINFSRKK